MDELKICETCKHCFRPKFLKPCRDCIREIFYNDPRSVGDPSNWTPKKEENK